MNFTATRLSDAATRPRHRVVWAALLLFLTITVPLFVCMPLTSDTALYDLQARSLLKGGVAYRDVIEPNLPGVLWLHRLIRPVIGWSSEAIRMFDLLIFGLSILLLTRICRRGAAADSRTWPSVLLTFSCCVFYLSTNEWCHCQRDTWMLLPVVAALTVRLRRTGVSRLSCLMEGILWGAAFWMKPHIVVPIVCIVFVDCVTRRDLRAVVQESAMIVAGGIVAAIPGVVWMMATDAWPHFWETMLEWNPEYLQAGNDRKTFDRFLLMFRRFTPWWAVHLVALPVAVRMLAAGVKSGRRGPAKSVRTGSTLAAVYVGWLMQSFGLQHAMDYIHVPEILLALAVISVYTWSLELVPRRVLTAIFLSLACLAAPQFRWQRLEMWPRCFAEGSTMEVRSQLAHGSFPDWTHMERVIGYLKDQEVRDHDLTCLNVHSVHIFEELNVLPSTRYWCMSILMQLFPSRYQQIESAVISSPHRFVVTDTDECSLDPGAPLPDVYPWNLPVVFQSGTYRVHKVPMKRKTSATLRVAGQ